MVIGLLTIAAIPTTIGVCEAVSAQKKQDNAAKEQAKFKLTAELSLDGSEPVEAPVVLQGGKMYVDHPQAPAPGFQFSGHYFGYPSEEQLRGLVSMVSLDPPALNWLYVDKDTHAVRHGGRAATVGHIVGSWYWSEDERLLTLEDNGSFVAVEEEEENETGEGSGDGQGKNKKWVVYFDREADDGVTGVWQRRRKKGEKKTRWAYISLRRRLGMESRYVKGQNG